MAKIQHLPAQPMRVETGVTQFGDDWPGIFIRGDDAFASVMALQFVLDGTKDAFARLQVEGLLDLLAASNVRHHSGDWVPHLPPNERAALPAPVLAYVEHLEHQLHKPETADFIRGVRLEAAHQVQRWGEAHDRNKRPAEWLGLIAWLASKALKAIWDGDLEKAKHHTVSTAAACSQWHAHLLRGGHDPSRPSQSAKEAAEAGE